MKLARHTLYNLLGLGLPLLAGLISIPPLLQLLGIERFGLLSLVWAITSYFGLFDLGLGRALTQQLAVALSRADASRAAQLCGTAMTVMGALGAFAGLIMVLAATWAVDWLGQVPDQREVVHAVWLMGLSLPFIVCTAGLRGILEARHDFARLNLIRVPMGLWTFLGPWGACVWFGPDLVAVTASLVFGRVLACWAHWHAVRVDQAREAPGWTVEWAVAGDLLRSGGWMTLSNIVSPFMGYVDRFVIAGVVSASAVAFYATPLDLVIKLSIFPAAITATLFPTLAALLADNRQALRPLTRQALHALLLAMALTALPMALFAEELLSAWLGSSFAQHSTLMLRLFCVGITVNALAHVPLTVLQGASAARLPALIHLVELPLFLGALAALSVRWGEEGAALAWLLRMILDTGLLFLACSRGQRLPLGPWLGARLPVSLLLLLVGFGAAWLPSWAVKVGAFVLVSAALALLWRGDRGAQSRSAAMPAAPAPVVG